MHCLENNRCYYLTTFLLTFVLVFKKCRAALSLIQTALQDWLVKAKSERLELGYNIYRHDRSNLQPL